MRCEICRGPAHQLVLYHVESSQQPGYLAIDDAVRFENRAIGCFLHYCASKGLHLKDKHGAVPLCAACLAGARVSQN